MTVIGVLPEAIEALRDQAWRRDAVSRIEDRAAAEAFFEEVGFCNALTDRRRTGPSLYVAVCGRRDAHLPRNVQKDPECRLTWTIKDEVIRREGFITRSLPGAGQPLSPPDLFHTSKLSGESQGIGKLQPYLILRNLFLQFLRREWRWAHAICVRRAAFQIVSNSTRHRRASKDFQNYSVDVVYEPTLHTSGQSPKPDFQLSCARKSAGKSRVARDCSRIPRRASSR